MKCQTCICFCWCLFLSFTNQLTAANWELFPEDQVSYFEKNNPDNYGLSPYYVDTIVTQGNDRIHYFMRQYMEENHLGSACYDGGLYLLDDIHVNRAGAHFDDVLIERGDRVGMTRIVQGKGDTLWWRPHAKLGEYWDSKVMDHHIDDFFIRMTCTFVGVDSVVNVLDSVKHFSLTFYQNNEQVGVYDGNQSLKLSKQYGVYSFLPVTELNSTNFGKVSFPIIRLAAYQDNAGNMQGKELLNFLDFVNYQVGERYYWFNEFEEYFLGEKVYTWRSDSITNISLVDDILTISKQETFEEIRYSPYDGIDTISGVTNNSYTFNTKYYQTWLDFSLYGIGMIGETPSEWAEIWYTSIQQKTNETTGENYMNLYGSLLGPTDLVNCQDYPAFWNGEDLVFSTQKGMIRKGFYGEAGTSITRRLIDCVTVDDNRTTFLAKVYLQGAYNFNQAQMNSSFGNYQQIDYNLFYVRNLLGGSPPFTESPWNYTGNENVSDYQIPPLAVDWIMVELRDNEGNHINSKIGFLTSKGEIINPRGPYPLYFNNLTEGESYYILIRHRNHLDVISKTPVTVENGVLQHDFTTSESVQGNNQLIELEEGSGLYGMRAGDFDGNGVITVSDFNLFYSQISTINEYVAGDANLDAAVTVADFNLYQQNTAIIGVSAVRY